MDCIVRARLHAGFAPDTAFGVEINNPILAPVHGAYRTNCDTGRFFTMIAARDLKDAASVGKHSLFDVFDPGAIHTDGHMVLCLACDRAGMAADALAIIDNETVFHRELLYAQCPSSFTSSASGVNHHPPNMNRNAGLLQSLPLKEREDPGSIHYAVPHTRFFESRTRKAPPETQVRMKSFRNRVECFFIGTEQAVCPT